jgi:8-oxo-dGTP pyrophosphatase MutT (NUDIX family)
MVSQKSCGIIIFRKVGASVEYLLLRNGGDYWNFPKGRVESGETELQTALREVAEETGIVASAIHLFEGFREAYDYDFDSEVQNGAREMVHKTGVFFLGEVGDVAVQLSKEHNEFGWFDFQTASNRLFYQNSKDTLQKAHQFLLKQADYVL